MKRKYLAVLMAMVLSFGVVACGGNASVDNVANNVSQSEETPVEETATEEIAEENDAEEADESAEAAVDETKEETEEVNEVVEENVVATDSSPEEAFEFARNLKVGYNLGNTLDAFTASANLSNDLASETCWGNPETTKELIDLIKECGFTSIRIPVSWHNHIEVSDSDGDGVDEMTINEAWLERVKTIVDWAIEDDMYAIINIHHDNHQDITSGEINYIPDYENEEFAIWYTSGVWEIVADYFKDYDEHLIFEAQNEPRLVNDDEHQWWYDPSNAHCKEAADVINKINQNFVDIVRNSGGNNVDRYLMVPAYCASIDALKADTFVLPTDTASNKLMVAFHAYVPYEFALSTDMSNDKFAKNTKMSTYAIDKALENVDKAIMSQGIPVVLGEFGCREKNDNTDSRVQYYEYYVDKCHEYGIPCFVWDNGCSSGDGERFALIDRKNLSVLYQPVVDAITKSWPND